MSWTIPWSSQTTVTTSLLSGSCGPWASKCITHCWYFAGRLHSILVKAKSSQILHSAEPFHQNKPLTFNNFCLSSFFFVFFLFRFIYVRHASRLLVDGVQMLHFVVTFFISLWISKRFFGLIWFGWIHEAPKMMFCTKNNISQLLAEDFAGYSVKPKIMSIMTFILVTIALNFFYFSAFKKR